MDFDLIDDAIAWLTDRFAELELDGADADDVVQLIEANYPGGWDAFAAGE